jgi:CYTH domain-containing protein
MGSGIIKDELEEKIDKKLFNKLWACCGENIVEKDRIFYEHLNGFVSEVGFVAEVDIYKGKLKGLKTVEVEFDGLSEANLFYPPSWFGKEVTNDNRYSNFNLSKSRFDKVTGELIE